MDHAITGWMRNAMKNAIMLYGRQYLCVYGPVGHYIIVRGIAKMSGIKFKLTSNH